MGTKLINLLTRVIMIVYIFLTIIVLAKNEEIQEYRIGGIFQDNSEEIAFRLAVNRINENHPQSHLRLISDTSKIAAYNSFTVYKSACLLLNRGIIGLFGPSSPLSSPYIEAICDRKEIPHIETHWDATLKRNDSLVNLHPYSSSLTKLFVDLIIAWKWRQVTVLYEHEESLARIGQLVFLNEKDERSVVLKKLEWNNHTSYRSMLMALKRSEQFHFVVDCSIEALKVLLADLQEVGLMIDQYNYIVTNLDLQTVDLRRFQYSGANITGIRLVNLENSNVVTISNQIQSIAAENDQNLGEDVWRMPTKTALLVDAVDLFFEAVQDVTSLTNNLQLLTSTINCNTNDNWNNGYTIINSMKEKTIHGLTGLIKFDNEGLRTDFSVDIMELTMDGLSKVGVWNSTIGLKINRQVNAATETVTGDNNKLFDKNFIVMSCLNPPYQMLTEATTQQTGNDRYEGYCLDLFEELSQIVKFNYTFKIQDDCTNGKYDNSTGKWNGMIGAIIHGDADFAVTDLTITSEREKYVDFSMPFMYLGISILYRKPEPVPPSLFMFTSPFSVSVWLMLGVAYVLVSVSFFIMGRLSQSEWTNPYPCVDEPDYLINQFSFRNCLWFTVGSLMQQGSEIAPVGISTRTAAGVWWFFTLIMVSSYTANLAAFLTVESFITSFKNVEELAAQSEIKYGALKGGATEAYFRNSNDTTHQKIWHHMLKNKNDMTASNNDGIERVKNDNYAFFMESSSIEYAVERDCKLKGVGSLLDEKGYGIAMKKDSPYRNDLSMAVLQLQERGRLSTLKVKWWKEKRGGGKCSSQKDSEAKPLILQNIGGVFLVLFVGTLLGVIGAFVELAAHIYRKCKKHNLIFRQEFANEMKLFISIRHNVKPVRSVDDLPESENTL